MWLGAAYEIIGYVVKEHLLSLADHQLSVWVSWAGEDGEERRRGISCEVRASVDGLPLVRGGLRRPRPSVNQRATGGSL